jgi:hypothetical protein
VQPLVFDAGGIGAGPLIHSHVTAIPGVAAGLLSSFKCPSSFPANFQHFCKYFKNGPWTSCGAYAGSALIACGHGSKILNVTKCSRRIQESVYNKNKIILVDLAPRSKIRLLSKQSPSSATRSSKANSSDCKTLLPPARPCCRLQDPAAAYMALLPPDLLLANSNETQPSNLLSLPSLKTASAALAGPIPSYSKNATPF